MAGSPSRATHALAGTPERRLFAVLASIGIATALVVNSAPGEDAPQATAESGPNATVEFDPASATLTASGELFETYTDAAGVSQTTLSLQPVNVERDGEWIPASARVEALPGGRWAVPDHVLAVEFAQDATDAAAVTVTRDGYEVSSHLVGADASSGKVEASGDESSLIVFEGAADGSNLEYLLSPNAVKETVVLESAPDSAPQYTWRLDTGELVAERNDAGEVVLLDAAGTVVITIPIPLMWDSSGVVGESEDALVNVDYALTELGAGR